MNRTDASKSRDSASAGAALIGLSSRWLRVRVQPASVAAIGGRHANAAFTIATIPALSAPGSPGHASTTHRLALPSSETPGRRGGRRPRNDRKHVRRRSL